MWSRFSEPSPRWGHVSVGVEGKVYVYGGRTKDFWRERSILPSRVHVFNPCQESWQLDRRPEGTPPPGLIDAACTSIGHHAYIYGGFDGQNVHGVLHQLNTSTLSWRELSTSGHGPTRKRMCGMINFDDQLLLFGGLDVPSGPTQPGAEFVEDPYNSDGSGWTNELHTFCLKGGMWSSPNVTGTRPPPCAAFSFTKYDDHHAVLFGGNRRGAKSNDVHIIDLTSMHWKKLVHQEGEPCPVARSGHAAVCLGYGGDHPYILVIGGLDVNKTDLCDAWMLDLQSGKWKEVKEPRLQARCWHSATAFNISPGLMMEVTLFGGCTKWPESGDNASLVANTAVLRFEYQQCDGAPTREWVLTDLADSSQLGKCQRVEEKMMKMWRMNQTRQQGREIEVTGPELEGGTAGQGAASSSASEDPPRASAGLQPKVSE